MEGRLHDLSPSHHGLHQEGIIPSPNVSCLITAIYLSIQDMTRQDYHHAITTLSE